ncbi:MAG: hypothetical protein K8823_1380 [Cenarchaeum symbiont of Oopsacas minuta]|nr:hypothetical protein [Cenarchaeum symbiont of Oopsacas minuta]
MKDVEISLDTINIQPQKQIHGTIRTSYRGRYDGIVINTQILDSNELLEYDTCNGKNIEKSVTRLFIPRDLIQEGVAEFTAFIRFEPKKTHDVKFRVSIIEQHKEVESNHIFAKYSI